MNSWIGIIGSILLLLPGFLVIKVKQKCQEYARLDTFETTTQSLAYSFGICVIWLIFTYISTIIYQRYDIKNVIINYAENKNVSVLFSKTILIAIFDYFIVGVMFTFSIFITNWVQLWKYITRRLDLDRYTKHLTPWEDFSMLCKGEWIAIHINDGRSFIGQIEIVSQLPFEKEIIISCGDDQIIVYDKNHKKEKYSDKVGYVFIDSKNISTIEILDKTREEIEEPTFEIIMIMLFLSFLWTATFFGVNCGLKEIIFGCERYIIGLIALFIIIGSFSVSVILHFLKKFT
jgi:hypothetical protein